MRYPQKSRSYVAIETKISNVNVDQIILTFNDTDYAIDCDLFESAQNKTMYSIKMGYSTLTLRDDIHDKEILFEENRAVEFLKQSVNEIEKIRIIMFVDVVDTSEKDWIKDDSFTLKELNVFNNKINLDSIPIEYEVYTANDHIIWVMQAA